MKLPAGDRCDARRLLHKAKRQEVRLHRSIRKHLDAREFRKASRQSRLYLRSRDCRLAAISAVVAKLEARGYACPSIDEQLRIARSDNLWSACSEKVDVKPIAKANGKYRSVCVFQIAHRARQWVANRLLKLRLPTLHPRQFALRGGRIAAVKAAAALIASNGFRYAAELDIANCFGSFSRSGIFEILRGLPRRVMETSVVSSEMNFCFRKLSEIPQVPAAQLRKKARFGLPPGSGASSIIAELLIAKLLCEIEARLPAGVELIVYADNILVLGATRDCVREACNIMSEEFRSSEVGQLKLRSSGVRLLRSGIDYLGYRICAYRGSVEIRLQRRKREHFIRKLVSMAASTEVERFAKSWLGSNKLDITLALWTRMIILRAQAQCSSVGQLIVTCH